VNIELEINKRRQAYKIGIVCEEDTCGGGTLNKGD
jgi:hypothetical protein